MSVTFTNLRDAVARAIRDPSRKTFSEADLGDIVNAALSEIGRVSPEQFLENIALAVNTLQYVPRLSALGRASQEIELARVEVWESVAGEPHRRLMSVKPAHGAYDPTSDAGWVMWGGVLYLPRAFWTAVAGRESDYYLRVWGYSPYRELVLGDDIAPISPEQRWALVAFARVESLERLNDDRELFTQWQTRAGNTDVSSAGLMNMLSLARDEWRRRKRELLRLRSTV